MYFKNRKEAAEQVAEKLAKYRNDKDAIVIAVPRGGVPVGAVIAEKLNLPLDVIIVKKLGHPLNPEYAIGSVSLNGVMLNDSAADAPQEYIKTEVSRLSEIVRARYEQFRPSGKPMDLEGKKVIITDDGVATGTTLLATIAQVKQLDPAMVIVAIPVSPVDTFRRLEKEVDELICLDTPYGFQSVGQFYENFPQVDDKEVTEILKGRKQAGTA